MSNLIHRGDVVKYKGRFYSVISQDFDTGFNVCGIIKLKDNINSRFAWIKYVEAKYLNKVNLE